MKDYKDKDVFERIYEAVRMIPLGRVCSYGQIARFIGIGSSARVVGWALKSATYDTSIPAHRVVNRNGLLTGKHNFSSANTMEELLRSEGVEVVDDKVKDFDKINWNFFLEQ